MLAQGRADPADLGAVMVGVGVNEAKPFARVQPPRDRVLPAPLAEPLRPHRVEHAREPAPRFTPAGGELGQLGEPVREQSLRRRLHAERERGEEGEEPDLLSVAIEWLVSIHVDVKGVS